MPTFHLRASQALWTCCCYHCCFVLFLQGVYCLNAESVWYNWTVNAIFVYTVVDIQTAFQMQCQYVRSVFSLPHYMYLARLLGTPVRPVPNEFCTVPIFLFYSNKCCICLKFYCFSLFQDAGPSVASVIWACHMFCIFFGMVV